MPGASMRTGEFDVAFLVPRPTLASPPGAIGHPDSVFSVRDLCRSLAFALSAAARICPLSLSLSLALSLCVNHPSSRLLLSFPSSLSPSPP